MLLDYETHGLPERDDLYEDLLDLGCGGQFYSAAYASAPHLVRLARNAPALQAAILLNTVAATIYFAGRDGCDPVDSRFVADFAAVRKEALSVAERLTDQVKEESERSHLALSIALFAGDTETYRKGIEEV